MCVCIREHERVCLHACMRTRVVCVCVCVSAHERQLSNLNSWRVFLVYKTGTSKLADQIFLFGMGDGCVCVYFGVRVARSGGRGTEAESLLFSNSLVDFSLLSFRVAFV